MISVRSNLTAGRIAAAHERCNGIHQVAPVCTPPNASLVPPKSESQTASGSVQPFFTAHRSVPILHNGPPLPSSKLPVPEEGSGLPSNTWLSGPTQVLSPSGISIGSTVFAGLTTATDGQTDRQAILLGW